MSDTQKMKFTRGRKPHAQTSQVMQILREEYALLDAGGVVELEAEQVAENTLARLDPDEQTPALVAWAATLGLRQMARALCRGGSATADPSVTTDELFSDELQRRYPAQRDGRDCYVLREHLTLSERRQCADDLRREGRAKVRHGDRLDAETDALIRVGALSVELSS